MIQSHRVKVEIVDYNRDGLADIEALGNLYLNEGNRVFTRIFADHGNNFFGDMNNDNIKDIINFYDGTITIFYQNSNERINLSNVKTIKSSELYGSFTDVCIADMNSDGMEDILVNHVLILY